ncbi:MAG: tRNA (adenosine(37)-N6)-threonylcarbamoyltransferase complex ATPase subunit type 1 TsaE [Bacteroidales bacterium]|jgi:tRNA threonylcarbamoyladenosine biosynthesis protein TsaE|nr:tRNA (adenosine(37)-N6)-threonylcarbamoyltransferase complex ATPase subunit type 1 TsaE [Bacteroidales bacterium]
MKKSYTIKSVDELKIVADALIESMAESNVFALYGSMGAGKTTFIKAICSALGVENVVNSPTFAIINEYAHPNGEPIFHFDFYRLNSAQEALNIGYQEYIESGHLCLMEWPEKIENLLPENCVYVNIQSDYSTGLRTIYWEV